MAQINKPNTYFNTLTWTGNATDNRAITGVGFQPDFTWIKSRSNAQDHALFDSTRGANKQLVSSSTGAEATRTDMLKSFDSDGFTLGDDQTGASVNYNGYTYVGWLWKGGGTASSNTDGSITSTVSANTTSGFSIVSWTGTGSGSTIGHGLGVKPKIIFVKNRSNTGNWVVNVGEIIGTDERSLYLNSTDAIKNDAQAVNGYTYNNTTTTFSTASGSNGNQNDVNQSSSAMIAYCFAEKKGFSKFGSYTGNGSTDGTFVYTGFKPAFIMVKRTDAINQWMIIDNKRTPSNTGTVPELFADLSDAENNSTDGRFDYLSNGLKARGTNAIINASGGTYIYMAFAENPLVGTNNIPACAR